MTQFIERNDRPISVNADFGLEPGDELFCRNGFIFTDNKSTGCPAVKVRVTVIHEYPRFILVNVIFDKDESRSYKECISKASYIARDVDFIRVRRRKIFSDFEKSSFASNQAGSYSA